MKGRQEDSECTAVEAQIRRFEVQIDRDDPVQVELLETMRSHLRHIQQGRGLWDTYTDHRCWNDPDAVKMLSAPPKEDIHYKAFEGHTSSAPAPTLITAAESAEEGRKVPTS